MSQWTNLSINIYTTETTSKKDIANVYERFARYFEGSEGGLDVSFLEKPFVLNEKINFINGTVLTNVLLEGSLRNVSESHYDDMIGIFQKFYDVLREKYLAERAIVILDCQSAERYVHIYCRGSRTQIEICQK